MPGMLYRKGESASRKGFLMLQGHFFCRFFYMMLFLVLGLSLSMASVFDHPMDAKSKQVLMLVLTQMNRHNIVTGDFKQTKSIKKLNRDFVTTGTFRISKTSGIVWKTQKPFPSEMTVSEDGITERNASGQVRTISSKDNPVFSEISSTIQALFSGNLSELETRFNIYYLEVKAMVDGGVYGTKSHHRIGLVPREASVRKMIANIEMDVSDHLDKVVITDGDGSPVIYEFTNQQTPTRTEIIQQHFLQSDKN